MAIAFVSRVQFGTTASISVIPSPAQSHTAGNLLVVSASWGAGVNFSSIANTAGDSWTQAGTELSNTAGNDFQQYYAITNGNAADIVSVTLSGGSTYCNIVVHEFSGIDATPLDDAQQGSGNSTAIATPSLTVTAAEDVIVAYMIAGGTNITGPGAPFSLTTYGISGDVTAYFADEYAIVTASTAATASCSSGAWGIVASAYKGGGGGATGQPTMRRWGGLSGVVGGKGIGQSSGGGKAWGRTRDGIYVPRLFAA